MSDSFTPAPLVSDQTVGGFVENDLTPPQTSAWDTTEIAPFLGRVARAAGAASATFGDIDEYGQQITPSEPPISKAEFDSKYSIPGKLDWDGPKPDSVYSSIYQNKLGELQRQDAAERRPAGLVSGAADLGVGFVADALDPLFLGSLIIPGAPEIDLGTSLAARTGARVLEGAAGGALQTAPLVGVNYALAKREQADYSAGSALADLAMGAGMGAALHVGMGAVGDYLDRRMAGSRYRQIIEQDPDARRAAFRAGLGQALNDDPVEVGPVLDASAYQPGGSAPYPEDQPGPVRVVTPDSPLSSGTQAGRHQKFWLSTVATNEQGLRQIAAEAGRGEHSPEEAASLVEETQGAIDRAKAQLGANIEFPDGSRYQGASAPGFVTEPTHPDVLTPGAQPLEPEPPEPQRLTSWLIAQGGVRDPGGDVRSSMGGFRGRPGLIANAGRTLDDAALNAWQAGFFPDHAERPTINDLLDAVDEDLKGVPHYSNANEAALANYQEARARNSEVLRLSGELGIPTTNITREQFFDAVAEHLSEEDFDARVGQEGQRTGDLYRKAERQASAWLVDHASPHTFDRFDTAHIGTGEGAQAFGHGLYFSEGEGTHQHYLNSLARREDDDDFKIDGVGHHSDEINDADEQFGAGASAAIDRMVGSRFQPDVARARLEDDIRSTDWPSRVTDENIREDLERFRHPTVRVDGEPWEYERGQKGAQDTALTSVQAADGIENGLRDLAAMAQYGDAADRERFAEGYNWLKANRDRVEFQANHPTDADVAAKRADWERTAAEQKAHAERAIDWLDANKDRITAPERGTVNSYRVRVHAEQHEMLDWDAPLAEQPAEVKQAFRHAGFTEEEIEHGGLSGRDAYQELAIRMAPERMDHEEGGWTSAAGGAGWTDKEEDARAASAALHEGGLKGIRYLDRMSRREGEGDHNVVVFNHDDLEITHRNGEAVEPHKPTEVEARELAQPHELQAGQEPHGGFDTEQFYGHDQGRSLEDLENDHRSEAAAADARERGAGGEPGGSPAGDQGGVSGGTEPGGSGVGAAGRESAEDRAAAFSAALRRADGQRPVDPNGAAADAAAKQGPTERLKQAQLQIDQDTEAFQRMMSANEATVASETTERGGPAAEAAAALAEEIRAELESLGEIDKQANSEGDGVAQAAVCVIRGLGGGTT